MKGSEMAVRLMELVFFAFLCFAAWKDWKTRQVLTGMLALMGVTGILARGILCWLLWKEQGAWLRGLTDWGGGLLAGGMLLALSRVTGGGLGAGDGWFFVVSAAWIGIEKQLCLLIGGMMLCFLFCGAAVIWGVLKGVSVKGMRIPFLPFLVPAAVFLLIS